MYLYIHDLTIGREREEEGTRMLHIGHALSNDDETGVALIGSEQQQQQQVKHPVHCHYGAVFAPIIRSTSVPCLCTLLGLTG